MQVTQIYIICRISPAVLVDKAIAKLFGIGFNILIIQSGTLNKRLFNNHHKIMPGILAKPDYAHCFSLSKLPLGAVSLSEPTSAPESMDAMT